MPYVIGAIDKDTGTEKIVKAVETADGIVGLTVLPVVYNIALEDYEPLRQFSTEDVTPHTPWPQQRMDYNASNCIVYRGFNVNIDAVATNVNWLIHKYFYDGSDNCIGIQGPRTGAWSNRASLDWFL